MRDVWNRRISLSLPILVVLLSLVGCDTVSPGGQTVILTTEIESTTGGNPILFSFAGSAVQTGDLVDLRCNCSLNLGPYLVSQGFSRSDVVAATLTSARIVMGTPISGRLNFLDQAILKLEAPGASPTELANLSILPASREAELVAVAGRSASLFVSASSFEPVLQIEAASLEATATYQIYLTLSFRIEVGGV